MKKMELKITVITLLYLITFVFGFWLSFSGRPLNTALFSVHKIAAVIMIIIAVLVVIQFIKNVKMRAVILSFLVVTGVLVLFALSTGIWLSIDKETNDLIINIHTLSSILAGISIAITIYLLANNTK
jgi:hypothetical protein